MNNKTAKDIMTSDVIVAKQSDSVASVAKLLIKEKIGGLPVVNEEYKVVGIISETDILKKEKYRNIENKREQINAVFYVVKTGCQWRNLPKDFPNWKTVYSFYRRACLNGIWIKIQKELVKKTRILSGKNENPSNGGGSFNEPSPEGFYPQNDEVVDDDLPF